MLQRHAIEKFHDDESSAVLIANLVDCAEVRMVQCGCGPGFPPESLQGLKIIGKIVRKEFQRNETAKRCVFGLVPHAHPAPAEFVHDAVVRDGLADERLGLCHLASMLGCPGGLVNEWTP